ncbi:MAG: hypothetical protein WBW74_10600 [Xanthobacteraceae bacterium]
MGSTFTATASTELFANASHTVAISYDISNFPIPFQPVFTFGFDGDDLPHVGDPIDAMEDFAFAHGIGLYFLTVFPGNAVDYSASTAPVFIDLQQATQHGGFAEGDRFFDGTMTGIDGSSFDDVIRGMDPVPPRDDIGITTVFNNPGDNIFNGGGGNDLLEGRGGADTLNGQSGFDLASYESSPAAVTVRLAGVNGDTQTALASGGDAAGDKLSSIEGLVGSAFGDRLTGNSLDNLLAGGLGSDILNGMGGTDTADYSRDHFFDLGDTPDRVEVHLAPGAGAGIADEFKLQGGAFTRVSTDALISIENVIGTAGNDVIVGNELDNRLEGREGSNDLDGGLGNDTLIGGSGIDTANYTSHDAVALQHGEQYVIALGLIGRPGSFTLSQPSSLSPGVLQVVESDVLIGIENVTGSNHGETITGNEFANVLDGRGGSDILDGGLGNDTLIGNTGTDTASFVSHDSVAVFSGEQDVISLGNGSSDGSYSRFQVVGPIRLAVETDILRGIENVTGSNHDETINGNDLANVLDGRGGNDVLDGGLGDDVIVGNGGTDTASYVSHDRVGAVSHTITLGLGGADGSYVRTANVGPFGSTQAVETDVLRGIENVTGSNQNEVINGNERDNVLDGRGGSDSLDGGLGNDVIIGGAGIDFATWRSHDSLPILPGEIILMSLGTGGADGGYTRFELVNGVLQVVETDVLRGIENLVGNSHSEIIIGNEQENGLFGNGGDDTLAGRGGDDDVQGGAGNDTYDFTGGGLSLDRFFDESGTADRVIIDSFSQILPSFGGLTTGQDGNDLLIILTTGTFRIVDHFNGHQIETIVARDTGQSMVLANGLVGGDGSGIIAGGKGAETLDGRGGDDFLYGNDGNDQLLGGTGNDHLFGGAGRDALDGQDGDDILDGGAGSDRLIGGAGRDTFVVAPLAASGHGEGHDHDHDALHFGALPDRGGPGAGRDVIEDFTRGQDRIDLTAFHTSFAALTAGDGHGHDGHGHDEPPVTLRTEGHDLVLAFAGGSVLIAGVTHLSAHDFIF